MLIGISIYPLPFKASVWSLISDPSVVLEQNSCQSVGLGFKDFFIWSLASLNEEQTNILDKTKKMSGL